MVPYLPYPRHSYTEPRPVEPVTVPAPRVQRANAPDLQTQMEAMLDAVWKAEADWRFNDRLDMAVKTRRDSAGR